MGGKGGSQEVTIGYKYFADVHLQASHGVAIPHRAFIAENCLWNYCPIYTEGPYDYHVMVTAVPFHIEYVAPPGYTVGPSYGHGQFIGILPPGYYEPSPDPLIQPSVQYGGGWREYGEVKDDVHAYMELRVGANTAFTAIHPAFFDWTELMLVPAAGEMRVGWYSFAVSATHENADNFFAATTTLRAIVTRKGVVTHDVSIDLSTLGLSHGYDVVWRLNVYPIQLDGTRRLTFNGRAGGVDVWAPIDIILPVHDARAIKQMRANLSVGNYLQVRYPPARDITVQKIESGVIVDEYVIDGFAEPQYGLNPPPAGDRQVYTCGDAFLRTEGLYKITSPREPVPIEVSKLNLFGGEEREGGVGGTAWLFAGDPDQYHCDALLAAKKVALADAPLYRGVAGVFFNKFYWGTQPYIKGVSVTMGRTQFKTDGQGQWLRAFATWPSGHWSFGDLNPVHIIREAYTDTVWGLGVPDELMGFSFEEVAIQAFDEGLGLSLVWVSETAVEDFVGEILRNIDGVVYQHPVTGKYEIKLIRADYVKATLPILDDDNSTVLKMGTPSSAALINQVTVKYKRRTNPCTDTMIDQECALVVQNPGAIMSAKRIINQTMEYPGISNDYNANRAALRDLAMLAQPLRTLTIQTNRKNFDLLPGDVFVLNNPDNGIGAMVFRVGKRSESPLANGSITLECIQDLFDVKYAYYQAPPPPIWTVPDDTALNFPTATIVEAPLAMLIRFFGSLNKVETFVDPGKYPVAMMGMIPSERHVGFRLLEMETIRPTILLEADQVSTRGFAPAIKMQNALDHMEDTITIAPEFQDVMALFVVGAVYIVGSSVQGDYIGEPDTREMVSVAAKTDDTITILRGVWDTTPKPIPAGTWLISVSYGFGVAPTTYTAAEEAHLVGLPCTNTDVFNELPGDPYYLLHLQVAGRRDAPYPPGNVRLNGSYDDQRIHVADTVDLVLEWNHRDAGILVDNTVSHYAPVDYYDVADPITYTVKWKGNDETTWHEEAGIIGKTYTLTFADEKFLRNILSGAPTSRLFFPSLNRMQTLAPVLTIMVVAVKDGIESLNPKIFTVTRIGYGYNMGIHYGGIL